MTGTEVLDRARSEIERQATSMHNNLAVFADLESMDPEMLVVNSYMGALVSGGNRAIEVAKTNPLPYLDLFRETLAAVDKKIWQKGGPTIPGFIDSLVLPELAGLNNDSSDRVEARLSYASENNCSAAEYYFMDALEQIAGHQSGHPDETSPQKYITVYHDGEGNPILLRKTHSSRSAMLLRQAIIGSTVIPPGTIVGVDLSMERGKSEEYRTMGYGCLATCEVPGTTAIRPLRLSPWAFDDPLDRVLFGVSGHWQQEGPDRLKYNEARGEKVAKLSIEDFRNAAKTAMEIVHRQPIFVWTEPVGVS